MSGYPPIPAVDAALRRGDRAGAQQALDRHYPLRPPARVLDHAAIAEIDAAEARGDFATADEIIDECTGDGGQIVPLDEYETRRADATRGRRLAQVYCPECDATVATIHHTRYGPLLRGRRPEPALAKQMRAGGHLPDPGTGFPYPAGIVLAMIAEYVAGRIGPPLLHCEHHGDLALPDGQTVAEELASPANPRKPTRRIRAVARPAG